jgi:hypothetical protein
LANFNEAVLQTAPNTDFLKATPPNITYHTPHADHNTSIAEEAESDTSCPDNAPKLAKSTSDISPEDVHTPSMQDELTFLDDDQLSFIQEDSVEKHSDLGDDSSANRTLVHAPSPRDGKNLAKVVPSLEFLKKLATQGTVSARMFGVRSTCWVQPVSTVGCLSRTRLSH